jgi:hypothetical protein
VLLYSLIVAVRKQLNPYKEVTLQTIRYFVDGQTVQRRKLLVSIELVLLVLYCQCAYYIMQIEQVKYVNHDKPEISTVNSLVNS